MARMMESMNRETARDWNIGKRADKLTVPVRKEAEVNVIPPRRFIADRVMIKTEIHIREARSDEASILSGLIRASFRDVAQRFDLTAENCPKHPSNCADEWINNDGRRGVIYYLLEYNGAPVGCVAMEKATLDIFYLERLSVLPAYRQKGFGRALVDYVIEQAKHMGSKRIGIGIISKQSDLKRWYQKIGFVEKETKEFPHLPFVVSFMEYEI